MKLAISLDYGPGFVLPEEFCEKYGYDTYEEIARNSPILIEYLEGCDDLQVPSSSRLFDETIGLVSIPDEATDFKILEYDGRETVVYVVDGRIHFERGKKVSKKTRHR